MNKENLRSSFVNSIKQVNIKYKMNEIVNKFLLAGDNFMPEMHLTPGFTYIASGTFIKVKERFDRYI